MRKFTATVVASIAMVALVSCQSDPTKLRSQDEAGSVLLSVTMVSPWMDLKSQLAPDFQLSGEQAIVKVAPTTANASVQRTNSFDFALGLGLTSNPANPASAPDVPPKDQGVTQQQTNSQDNHPQDAKAGQAALDIDPMLLYKTSNSLHQYVQLINAEVEHVAMDSDAVPYIVQLQLAFMPYRHDIPYDLHTLISFFLDTGSGSVNADSTVSVTAIPLLVTDDIEKATMQMSSDTKRKFAIAMDALAAKAGANANLSDVAQVINSVSAHDINSRLTVSRESQNTIYARIGAGYEGTKKFALVGQTYDVFVFLLVPRDHTAGAYIRMISNTQFRNAEDGTVLKPRSPDELLDSADSLMSSIFALDDLHLRRWVDASPTQRKSLVRELVSDIQGNEYYKDFLEKLCGDNTLLCHKEDSDNEKRRVMAYGKSVWAALSRLLADSQFKSAIINLPSMLYEIPEQTAVLEDDTDGHTSNLKLGNIVGDPTQCISATLVITKRGQPTMRLAAQHVTADTAQGTLALTFESMKALHVSLGTSSAATLEISKRTDGSHGAPAAGAVAGAHPNDVPMLVRQQGNEPSAKKSLAVCSDDSEIQPSYPVVMSEAISTQKAGTAKGGRK